MELLFAADAACHSEQQLLSPRHNPLTPSPQLLHLLLQHRLLHLYLLQNL